ncbi:MAG: flavin-containing monooxygenase [Bacteroidia bacterium]
MNKLDHQIGIIGAGFSGIVVALRFKAAGHQDFVMFERAAEIGGNWRDNTYPGCACDIPSHLYAISTEPNSNWSETYSGQAEIVAYMKQVFEKHQLAKHTHFNTDIHTLQFEEKGGYWRIIDQNGKETTVKLLIWAIGPLNRPIIPNLEGLDSFQGKIIHSGEWDSSYDLHGKKVAIIGTGASAIQIVPKLADKVGQLVVFQRTAPWLADRRNRKFTTFEKKMFQYLPFTRYLYRESLYWFHELTGLSFMGNAFARKIVRTVCLTKLKREVKSPHLRQQLTPNYEPGCKRILVSDDYYPAFARKNVQLETTGIAEISPKGIKTKQGVEYELDSLVFCTGFEVADYLIYTNVIGRKGINLRELWQKEGMSGYLGTTVRHFPNFAFMLGPNTGLGHNSMIHIMESQMNYILPYWEALLSQEKTTFFDVKEEVQTAYNQKLSTQFQQTVWTTGCSSWYQNSHQKPTVIYPFLPTRYRKEMKHFDIENYESK